MKGGERNGARAYFVVPIGASAISLSLRICVGGHRLPGHPPARPRGSFLFFSDPFETPVHGVGLTKWEKTHCARRTTCLDVLKPFMK